jgi:hypothetical protein
MPLRKRKAGLKYSLNYFNMSNRTSVQSARQPYMRDDFYTKPENQFWESSRYTSWGKEYYREFVRREAELAIQKRDQASCNFNGWLK